MAFTPAANPILVSSALLYGRLAIGALFIYAGWFKIRGEFENSFGNFYRGGFKSLQPAWLPDLLAAPYGYALPWIELVLGVMLVLGVFGAITAALVTLVMLSICLAQLFAGQLFGFQSGYPENAGPYDTNLILLGLALLLAIFGPGRFSVDALWRKKTARTAG